VGGKTSAGGCEVISTSIALRLQVKKTPEGELEGLLDVPIPARSLVPSKRRKKKEKQPRGTEIRSSLGKDSANGVSARRAPLRGGMRTSVPEEQKKGKSGPLEEKGNAHLGRDTV